MSKISVWKSQWRKCTARLNNLVAAAGAAAIPSATGELPVLNFAPLPSKYARQEVVTIMQSKLLYWRWARHILSLHAHRAAHANAKCAGWYDSTQVASRLLIAFLKKKKKIKVCEAGGCDVSLQAVTLALMQPTEWLLSWKADRRISGSVHARRASLMALQRRCQGGDNDSNSKLSCELMLDVHEIREEKWEETLQTRAARRQQYRSGTQFPIQAIFLVILSV